MVAVESLRTVIEFGRAVCGNLSQAEAREWLVTNGIGGYASGTVAGLLTRCYHGLLVAALNPPLGRTLLLTKLDEVAQYDGRLYQLCTNRWANGTVEPHGYQNIECFQLEGTIPVWKFACGDALLEKRVWMQPGSNTTYVRYDLYRSIRPLTLFIKALVNYRDYHSRTKAGDWRMTINPCEHGVVVSAFTDAVPLYLLSDRGDVLSAHDWYYEFDLAVERYRGLSDKEDHLHAATFSTTLQAGEALTVVASTESHQLITSVLAQEDYGVKNRRDAKITTESLSGGLLRSRSASEGSSELSKREKENVETLVMLERGGNGSKAALDLRRAYEQKLVEVGTSQSAVAPNWVQHLVLAADQFIVNRSLPSAPDGKTIIAGYHWFSDWGRDTMISLPGLTVSAGRPELARLILRTFAHYTDQGMLPNRFPDAGELPEYNAVDASFWYFEAVRAYHAATGDEELLQELFPVLREIIDWHCRGTRYNIHLDRSDGLLYAGESGVQLTWMDAKVGDWVVTPRIGKPIEVNALWYNALRSMAVFAQQLGKPDQEYKLMQEQAATGFTRFWNDALGYCYDVLDGPQGHDDSLRPNQIFTVSLPASPLTSVQQQGVVESCARFLLTSHGLRSLAPNHPQYQGHYGGSPRQRDGAYHQGTVWGWLIGPFVLAHLRVFQDPVKARSLLEPMANHLCAHGVGSLSEIFDGDAPMTPRGCIAQAWTVAEVLRAWIAIQNFQS